MEALTNSAFVPEAHPVLNNPTSIKTPNNRSGFLKVGQSCRFAGIRVRALSGEASGSGESEELRNLNNGFGLLSEDTHSLSQVSAFASFSTYFVCMLILQSSQQLCVTLCVSVYLLI